MSNDVFASVSVSIWLLQFLHDGVNFRWFCLLGWLLLKLLRLLCFNVEVDAGSLIGLIPGAFRWRFGHSDSVFIGFNLVSMQGCVGYQIINQDTYCGINWVMCQLKYLAYYCQTACCFDDKYILMIVIVVYADCIVVRIVVGWVIVASLGSFSCWGGNKTCYWVILGKRFIHSKTKVCVWLTTQHTNIIQNVREVSWGIRVPNQPKIPMHGKRW